MLLLMDENVPDDLARFFQSRGHEVRLVRDLFPPKTKDPVIAKMANLDGAIIVTFDRDFKSLVSRAPRGSKQEFPKLGRVWFRCPESRSTSRAKDIIESIEFEFDQTQKRQDKRLFVTINDSNFVVTR